MVVGIGTSAGGIHALQAFFGALPDAPGAAFVVVMHLDPRSHSELSSILAARTPMPVMQVKDTEKLEADHVYVIAPDSRLHIAENEISAVKFDEPRGQRATIDMFFRSLAERHGDGLAVILTGAGSDGAGGVKDVKEAGGIILVQDPNEAEYPSMPRSAIATGVTDFILPLHELAVRLVELIRDKDSIRIPGEETFTEELVRRILAHVRLRTGHDFSEYKRSTILRRIVRRMQVTRSPELGRYYDFLRDNADEAQALLGDLLVSVTAFFRDSETFDTLKREVIPHIFEARDPGEAIRVWVAGCATGEEAYSFAILLLEEAARHEIRPSIQLFGSDLDGRALTVAREGRYPKTIEADVSEERLRRFFSPEGDHYRVRRELRDMIAFAVHDLVKDPPFSRIDLLSCRNVLIYLNREIQSQICRVFHYAMNPNGFLVVGSAETADNPPGLFRLVEQNARVYRLASVPRDRRYPVPPLFVSTSGPSGLLQRPTSAVGHGQIAANEALLHRQALEKIAPPSILVDRTHRVVHLSNHAGRYLLPMGGPLSGDVVDLARPELKLELRSALRRAFDNSESTLSFPLLVTFNGTPHRVHLQVKPVSEDHEDQPRNAVVLFIEGEAIDEAVVSGADGSASDERIRRLSDELLATQARLRTTLEQSVAATEALRASNEELQSTNEEYRSTSEELETSKEELQSINEELNTVNNELKSKLDMISRAHSDLQNLMAATDFGILFLDPSLRIKLFTEPVTGLFRITHSDEGRPVTDFAHHLEYADLAKDAQNVLSRLTPIRHDLRSQDDRWYDVRLRPYRTVEDKIDGVVITFVDITERRGVDLALRESERQLRQIKRLVDLSRDPIFVWDLEDGLVEWNRGCEELYGYSREEALGQQKGQLLRTTGAGFSFADVEAKLIEEGSWRGELRQRSKSGRMSIVDARMQLDPESRRFVLETSRDITERRAWEQRQELLLRELTHRVKNTMAVVQSIVHQTLRSRRSGEDFEGALDGRLFALASAHDLLVESNWRGADFAALARKQLQPHGSEESHRWTLEGEPVLLPPDIAANFGLVLHELATNAAKHGVLSQPGGNVRLSWTLVSGNQQRSLTVEWKESGGPPVGQPMSHGFGSVLIERAIPNAAVSREYRPDGLLCRIVLALPEADGNGATRDQA
ncbi:MAG TPA: chemotaxis protein CheB [Methylocella sp.]|nr:chemotaxis protein CheB [Methylocella sp.]